MLRPPDRVGEPFGKAHSEVTTSKMAASKLPLKTRKKSTMNPNRPSRYNHRLAPVLALAFMAFACIAGAASAQAADRPNVLLIVADDQSPFDLKPYRADSELDVPNIEQLARDGVVFDAAYHMGSWSGAVCTPSRHMIMSGSTVWHVPDRRGRSIVGPDASKLLAPKNLAEQTLAAVFNRAGYDTMRTCKKGNSYEGANSQFTVRHDATKRGGTASTGSAWHADQVLNYLNDRAESKDDDPFLIYFGFSHPHDTRDGTPELLEKYGAKNHTDKNKLPERNGKQPKLPMNYLPAHPFHHGHPNLRDEVAVKGVWKNRDEATIRNELGRQFACSENIDIQIGRVLDRLKAMGELDNTIIIYTADHGMAIGRHGLQGKQNLYEHTWRVPLIVKGPGIQVGKRAPGNVYLLDLLATLCDLTGTDAPRTNEGLSFKPVLEGKKQSMREVMYGVYCGGTKPGMRCVRKGDWKLIKYDALGGEVRETQLFNLAQNPHELLIEHAGSNAAKLNGLQLAAHQMDLAENPKYAEKRRELEDLLLAEMKRLDDPFRFWDQPEKGAEKLEFTPGAAKRNGAAKKKGAAKKNREKRK